MDYVDPEPLLVAWIDADPGPETARTELPPEFVTDDGTSLLPLVLINHFGGADEVPTLPAVSVDFVFYADGQDAASALARKWHHKIRFGLAGTILTHNDFSATVTWNGTSFLPRPDYTYTPPTDIPGLFRYLASYALIFKTRSS